MIDGNIVDTVYHQYNTNNGDLRHIMFRALSPRYSEHRGRGGAPAANRFRAAETRTLDAHTDDENSYS